MGALMPESLSAPVNVAVFQCPCGIGGGCIDLREGLVHAAVTSLCSDQITTQAMESECGQ